MFRVFAAVLAAGLALVASRASAAPDVEAYGRPPAMDFVRVSPSGQRLAYVKAVGRARKLLITDLSGKVLQSAALDNVKLRDIQWAGDSHVLAVMTSTVTIADWSFQRFEISSVAVLDPDTHKALVVFAGNTRIVNVAASPCRRRASSARAIPTSTASISTPARRA